MAYLNLAQSVDVVFFICMILRSEIRSELNECKNCFFDVTLHRYDALCGACYAGDALRAQRVGERVGKGHFAHEVYYCRRILVLLHEALHLVYHSDDHDFYFGSSRFRGYFRKG